MIHHRRLYDPTYVILGEANETAMFAAPRSSAEARIHVGPRHFFDLDHPLVMILGDGGIVVAQATQNLIGVLTERWGWQTHLTWSLRQF